MSKGSEFWGNASGKLGQQVLYRAGGEQRARMYVDKIKNPKSFAQMKNRLLMNNVVSAFRALKPLLVGTFPKRKTNQSAFNAFVQANKNVNPYYIGKEEIQVGACVPYGLTIAQGNMGVLLQPKLSELKDGFEPDSSPKYGYAVQGLLNLTDFVLEIPNSDPRSSERIWWLSPSEVYEIFSKYCTVALPAEFQVSVISAVYAEDDADLGVDIWQPGYKINHAQAYNAYAANYGMAMPEESLRIGLHAASREMDEAGNEKITYDYLVVGNTYLSAEDAIYQSVGLVVSFKDASGAVVSTSRMSVTPTRLGATILENPASDFIEGGFYFEQLMQEYGYTSGGALMSQRPNTPPVETPEIPEDEIIPDA